MARDPWAKPKSGGGAFPLLFGMFLALAAVVGGGIYFFIWLRPTPPLPPINLQSGDIKSVVLLPEVGAEDKLDQAAGILRKRLEAGELEAQVEVRDGTLVIDVAADDASKALRLALAGGALSLHAAYTAQTFPGDFAAHSSGLEALGEDETYRLAKNELGEPLLLLKPGVAGFELEDVKLHEREDGPLLELAFSAGGAAQLKTLMAAHKGGILAFLVDGTVKSQPRIATPIEGNTLGWDGLTADEAWELRAVLLGGDKLPLELTLEAM